MKVLKGQDILALGFMTFALFVGAGNIIFPPIVGLQAGPNVWMAALGFLITAVGLPVVTVIALAKVGGGMDALSSPIGKIAGGLLAAVAYLGVRIPKGSHALDGLVLYGSTAFPTSAREIPL